MAENVQSVIRLDPGTIARIEALIDYVSLQGGYVAARADALRDCLAKGLLDLERLLGASRAYKLTAPPLGGDGTSLSCRVDPRILQRARLVAEKLTERIGLEITLATALREAVARGVAVLEHARDGG